MNTVFKILFEVKLLHEYYLTDTKGENIFDINLQADRINFLREKFKLSPAMEGWIMSSALLGCVVGAAIAGYLSDKYGRKKILLMSAFLFIISAYGCMIAESPAFLVFARIVGGVGVGFAATIRQISLFPLFRHLTEMVPDLAVAPAFAH